MHPKHFILVVVAHIYFSFVLASTQELHEKIAQLATRVRELEDGLRGSHSLVSNEQHPLLAEELLKIKAPLQRDMSHHKTSTAPAVKEEENNDAVDASGSLVISESKAKFYGQTASSWVRNGPAQFLPSDLSSFPQLFLEVRHTAYF